MGSLISEKLTEGLLDDNAKLSKHIKEVIEKITIRLDIF